ncbi:MAG: type II toxin-antitoxin system PemK/MazF family toxin [Abditibacteriales bacterium]|nr:type II toxin-antitoxin system PemK/MazF family toxin [Abditibacteriales bacterium]MDW8364821.1 type II toxin-antitoxin system PemK/MazF family toxin [Abditibacteriales bacterium]
MHRGGVWRVRLPFGGGREQAGERPAIIIQDDAFIQTLPLVLIVPLTGEMAASRFAGTLVIQPDAQNGLTISSVALVFQTRGLDKRRFLGRLGVVDAQTLDQILTLLDRLTGR